MKNKLLHFLEDMSPQARNAFWSITVLLVASGFNSIGAFRQASSSGTWHAWVEFAVVASFFIALLISAFLNLRGRTHQALGLMFGGFLFTIIARSALTEGLGVFYALIIIAITSVLAYFNLPRKTANRLTIASIVIGGLIVLFDLVVPSYRQPAPAALLKSLPVIASLVFLFSLFLIIRQAWRGNIRLKLVTSFTIVALISTGIVGTVVYISYRNQVREDIRQRLLNILSLVAMNQDGDLHASIYGPEDVKEEAHLKILDQNVKYLSTDSNLKYIYTMRKNEQGQIYFVINARQGGEPGDPIGTIYNEPSELLRTQFDTLSKPVVEEDLYIDVYGQVLASYAPFYRSDGTREGIIGVDMDAGQILAEQRSVLNLIVATTLVTMIIVILIGLFLGNLFTRPILNLSSVAQKITDGNLDARAKIETTDEIGDLATAFNTMTSQLQETLQGLEQRVESRTKDLATVSTISTKIATVRDPFQMLATMVHLTQRGFDLYHAHVFTYHKDSENLQIMACGYKEGDEHEGTHGTASIPISQEQSLVARAARSRKPVIVNNVRSDPGWLPNPLLPETWAEMAVPMIVGDELLGVLDVQADHVDAFTEEDANIQMTLASQISTSYQSALAYEQSKAQADLESLVNTIGQKIQRTATVEDTLQTAIRELGLALGASRVSANIQSSRQQELSKESVE